MAKNVGVLCNALLLRRMAIAHERHQPDIRHGREAHLQELPHSAQCLELLPRQASSLQNGDCIGCQADDQQT